MAIHKTFFGRLFGWIGDIFHNANHGVLQVAIDVTNKVKDALNSGIVDFITGLIPGQVDDNIVKILRDKLPVILADELLVQSVGTVSTPEEAKALADKILTAFGGLKDEKKQEFYTSVAANIYKFLQNHLHGEKVTFGQAAALAEAMYQEWLNSQAKK